MARRRQDTGQTVNLSPFLSILVCIIGCLTLVIVVINLIAMNKGEGQTPEEVERAREYMALKKEKEEKQVELDKLRQLIENLIQQNKDTLAARDKLTALKDMLENQEKIEETREELIAKFNILTQTNKDLLQDHTNLLAEIEEKEKEIAKRNLPPDPPALRVRPSGSSGSTRPLFAEISDAGVYLHRSLSEEPVAIPLASINQSAEFIQLLETVAAQPYNRLIFLVRGKEGAVQSLRQATAVVSAFNQSNGTEIIPGRIPLPGEGKIDLAMFAEFLQP